MHLPRTASEFLTKALKRRRIKTTISPEEKDSISRILFYCFVFFVGLKNAGCSFLKIFGENDIDIGVNLWYDEQRTIQIKINLEAV